MGQCTIQRAANSKGVLSHDPASAQFIYTNCFIFTFEEIQFLKGVFHFFKLKRQTSPSLRIILANKRRTILISISHNFMLNDRYTNNTNLYNHQILLRITKLFIASQSVCSAHYTLRTDSFQILWSKMLN